MFLLQFGFLFFLFLIWLWLELPILCLINVVSLHPCLVPDFRGNAFSFLSLSMMLAMGFSYTVFIMWRYVPSMPDFWRIFIINRCWICQKFFFFLYLLRWSYGFYFSIHKSVLALWIICGYWNTLISLGLIPSDHGVWSF